MYVLYVVYGRYSGVPTYSLLCTGIWSPSVAQLYCTVEIEGT